METVGATPMPRAELLNVADTVAREKGIEPEFKVKDVKVQGKCESGIWD